MIVDALAGAGSEELSIAEASLEFGLREGFLRKAVRAGRLERIAHRSGLRVRREDVAALAASPQSQVAHPAPLPAHQSSTRQSQRAAVAAEALRLVGELGEASVSQVNQRLIEGGTRSVSYLAVGTILRELAKEGKLATHRDGHRLLYHLRTEADDIPPAPRPPVATPTPRPKRTLTRAANVPLTTLEEAVLEAMRKLGSANLDQIYRALAQPAGASYPEFVLAVRGLVHQRLVIRIQERGRYFYRVGE